MEHWIALKALLVAHSGIDRDALHIYAALGGLVFFAILLRRPVGDPVPWFMLLLCELVNESTNILADGRIQQWELVSSAHDLLIAMSVPTAFLLAWNLAPRLFNRPEPRLLQPDWSIFTDASRKDPPIEYADWEEVPTPGEKVEDTKSAAR